MPLNCFTKLPDVVKDECDTSTDDEINSCGEYEDEKFAIESLSSEEEVIEEMKPNVIIQEKIVCTQNIIDCCSYSDENLFLYRDGSIICQKHNQERKINCNRHLKRIVVFDGEIYGMTKGDLYVLSMDYYDTCYWVFTHVKWAPSNVVYVNVTLDEKCIWIETHKKCYLFDCHNNKTKYDCRYKRVYGLNKKSYLDFSDNQCRITINNKMVETVNDVTTGVIDCHNQITFVYVDDQYKDIRIVNHKPYWINN